MQSILNELWVQLFRTFGLTLCPTLDIVYICERGLRWRAETVYERTPAGAVAHDARASHVCMLH